MEPNKDKIVAVSGGFDPVHVGHLRMFEAAKALGTHLVVILNNDNWLRGKKGKPFMPEEERAEIIRGFACVDEVYITDHAEGDPDRSVSRALEAIVPHVFANGGDRNAYGEGRREDNHLANEPIPKSEADVCAELGIQMAFNVGGGKVQSSSWLIENSKLEHA